MKPSLNIIVDVSGSMNEMGKIHLQRNLCRYAAQLALIEPDKYTDFNIRFYQWGLSVSEVHLKDDGDIPLLEAKGSTSLSVLADFLSQKLTDSERLRVLILSDGNFSTLDIVSFKKLLSSYPEMVVRTVAVGADADLLKLKKTSTNNKVYLSENIASAIESTIFDSDEILVGPISAAQFSQAILAESVESEDEWDA